MFVCAWFSLLTAVLQAEEGRVLAPGQEVEAELPVGAVHVYRLEIEAGDRVEGTLIQHAGDLRLTLEDPDGDEAPVFDLAPEGQEPFRFGAARTGALRLTVSASGDAPARYLLHLGLCAPEADTPEGKAAQFLDLVPPSQPGVALIAFDAFEAGFAHAAGRAPGGEPGSFDLFTPIVVEEVELGLAAYAVLLLVERNDLALDDAVAEVATLPELDERLQVHHVLRGDGGLRDLRALDSFVTGGEPLRPTDDRLTELLLRQRGLNTDPGDGDDRHGTETRALCLRRIVEQTSGESYGAWLKREVFTPLGMDSAEFVALPPDFDAEGVHRVPRMAATDLMRWIAATGSEDPVFGRWRELQGSPWRGWSFGIGPDLRTHRKRGTQQIGLAIDLRPPARNRCELVDAWRILTTGEWPLTFPRDQGGRPRFAGGTAARGNGQNGDGPDTVDADSLSKREIRSLEGVYVSEEIDLEITLRRDDDYRLHVQFGARPPTPLFHGRTPGLFRCDDRDVSTLRYDADASRRSRVLFLDSPRGFRNLAFAWDRKPD